MAATATATRVSHGVSAEADRGKLAIALALLLGFMAFEVVVGILVHSLTLLSDAAHMLTDAGAIALSLVAQAVSRALAGQPGIVVVHDLGRREASVGRTIGLRQ